MKPISRRLPRPARLRQMQDRLGQLVMHEAGAIDGHVEALAERLRVARRAHGIGELLRDQIDLMPATLQRLQRDQAERRRLWRRVRGDFREG